MSGVKQNTVVFVSPQKKPLKLKLQGLWMLFKGLLT